MLLLFASVEQENRTKLYLTKYNKKYNKTCISK